MYWSLQENFLHKNVINKLCNFIKKNKRFTQFKKVKEFENLFKSSGVIFFIIIDIIILAYSYNAINII